MISSFKHKGLREFFETNSKRGIPPELSTRLRDRLDVIDAAATLEDIALPQLRPARAERRPHWHVGGESEQELEADLWFCGRRRKRGKL